VQTRSRSETTDGELPVAVAIVDPFSTGAHLAALVCSQGYKCLRVFSIWDSPVAALVQQGIVCDFSATIQHNDQLKDQDAAINDTVAQLRALPYNIAAVIPGAETGVELADSLSHRMKLRSNGEAGSLARRNKYHMGEAVRNAGVRAVKQHNCSTIDDMLSFCKTLTGKPFKCVVKPVQSAGTDDVFLCSDIEEATTAFNRIIGKRNGLGLINHCVLVQEYLVGKEYVIDKVSKDGVHKLVAIWEYDKRSINGANFIYFGMKLHPSTDPKAQQMVAYADLVLNALGIMQGPSHMEIMYCSDGPCLVEVGSRCHGGEGTWLPVVRECIGYSVVDVTLSAYLDSTLFDSIQKDNFPLVKSGRDVDFVNRKSGVVRAFPGESIIRGLPSFRSISWELKPGDYAPVTIDCFTRPGCAQLVHESEEQVEKDFQRIHSLEEMGLIDYAVICPTPPIIGAIVIVDPFSTGAHIGANVLNWGYKLILIFSQLNSPVAKLVSKGTNVNPTLLIQHDESNPNQEEAIEKTMKALSDQGAPVLAILPGAETGVELAETLATRYGTRSNGQENIHARRNKYLMQETIRAAGVRAINQKLCFTNEDVKLFLQTFPSPLKCIVKPNESAGSDSIFLCTSVEQACDALSKINGQINGLGNVNKGALCQEYLDGTEYVVDGVSRDGVYKVTAVWEYDKRGVNGANFVYFGMKLRDGTGKVETLLIEYGKRVVEALGILQGPSHMEIKLTATGPCLVEVGSRCHGGEGTWLPVVQECVGYSQVDATLNCYVRPDRFDALPFVPTLQNQGSEAFLISHTSGTLLEIPGIDEIRSLSSFRRMEMLTQPGMTIQPTIDCFTRPGSVQLVNKSAETLEKDYAIIRELEHNGLFAVTQ
jgi:biotin carboxylase